MRESLKYLSLLTQVGLTVVFMVFLFTALGVYLDRRLRTGGIFTLIFVLLGCFAAGWTIYQLVLKTIPSNTERK